MRSGVAARLASRMRKVQSPSVVVMKLMGLAPRSFRQAKWPRQASGARHATHTTTLSAVRPRRVIGDLGLVVLLQVHARVERRDLIAVAVERQGLPAAELADAPLGGLAPARVVHRGIHVRVEAVLRGRGLLPCRLRLLAHEADPYDALRALEALLPREPQR